MQLSCYISEEYFSFRHLLKYEDSKVANYSSMAVYNIVLGCPDIRSVVADYDGILELLIDNAVKDSEFA